MTNVDEELNELNVDDASLNFDADDLDELELDDQSKQEPQEEPEGKTKKGFEFEVSTPATITSQEELEAVLEGHLEWLEAVLNPTKKVFKGRANLSSADLTGFDLSGMNFSGASFQNTILDKANLTGTNLTGSDLSGASLIGANLTGAKLRRVALNGTDLTDAIMDDTDLKGTDLGVAVGLNKEKPSTETTQSSTEDSGKENIDSKEDIYNEQEGVTQTVENTSDEDESST